MEGKEREERKRRKGKDENEDREDGGMKKRSEERGMKRGRNGGMGGTWKDGMGKGRKKS